MSRARKALTAGIAAAAAVVVTAIQTSGLPTTAEGWAGLAAGALGAALAAGFATYWTKNADPLPAKAPRKPGETIEQWEARQL